MIGVVSSHIALLTVLPARLIIYIYCVCVCVCTFVCGISLLSLAIAFQVKDLDAYVLLKRVGGKHTAGRGKSKKTVEEKKEVGEEKSGQGNVSEDVESQKGAQLAEKGERKEGRMESSRMPAAHLL